jgi:MHS family alpha-ketoglutarate permease-like MFS transporter
MKTADMADSGERQGLSPQQRLKSILGGSVGNLVEWYDWYVYAAFSLYFASVFFPPANPTVQLLNAAAVFAVGFIVRPIGGWIMGWYADRHGRKAALTLSVTLMCAGSLLIAVTPGYAQIGMFSPAILVFARIVQGLSLGGEYGTSATYLSEMATERNRGFYSSFQYVTLIMGQLMALSVLILLQQVFLTPEELESWGWRIPFLIGGALAIAAVYIRRGIEETPSFEHSRLAGAKGGLLHLIRTHPRQILIVIGLTLGGTIAFYTFTTYAQKFLVNSAGWSKDDATWVTALALLVFMLLQPVFGALSDRIGRRPLLIAFGIMGTIFTVPILQALGETRDIWTGFLLIMAALLIVSGYTSINAVVKAELFSAEVRALGVGLPYAISVSLFGGTAEYVALWLKSIGHEQWFFWYVAGCIAVSLCVYVLMRDTRQHSSIL